MSGKKTEIDRAYEDLGYLPFNESVAGPQQIMRYELSEPSDDAPYYKFPDSNLPFDKEASLRNLLVDIYCNHYQNAFDRMRRLVDTGMDVNMPITARELFQTRTGTILTELINRFPVMAQDKRSCLAVIQLLLEHGANVNAIETTDSGVSHKEKNALGQAEFYKDAELIQLLTKYGAKESIFVSKQVTAKSKKTIADELKKQKKQNPTFLKWVLGKVGRRKA